LSNTRARLQQLYGKGQRFELANAPGGGLAVCVELPFHPANKTGAGAEAAPG